MRLPALRQDPNAKKHALQFPSFLLKVGEEHLPVTVNKRIPLPSSVHNVQKIRNLCHCVFQGTEPNHTNYEWIMSRAILAMKNVEQINIIVGAMVSGTYRTYLSAATMENKDEIGRDI